MVERDWREIMWRCERWLGQRRPARASELLNAAAAALPPDAWPDRYGEGEFVESFERRIAELLGKQAAALFPSGTMAQQIALRIHCDRRRVGTVAFHPTCHLELHEHGAYAHLHGLKAELIGDRDHLITLQDLEAIHAPVGALLIELPQREIGGRLPEWEDLLAQAQWAREGMSRPTSTVPASGKRRLITIVRHPRLRRCSTPCMSRCTKASVESPAVSWPDQTASSPRRGFGDVVMAGRFRAFFRLPPLRSEGSMS